MHSLFALPDELAVASLLPQFPCRELQIRALATLLYPKTAPCKNIILHGTEATGKSSITKALLRRLSTSIDSPGERLNGRENDEDRTKDTDAGGSLDYAVVNSIQCITARHLFERALGLVADALDWEPRPKKCETVSQLAVELSKMLNYASRPDDWRFVLVFDAIDRQRDAPPTLLPALARLSELMPRLTCVFIVTSPPAGFLKTSLAPSIRFPNYTKSEFVEILSQTPPATLPTTTEDDTLFIWPRFLAAVHDAFTSAACRTLPAYRHACEALWPRFTAPVLAGTHGPREFSKLYIAGRVLFQDESLLKPSIVSVVKSKSAADGPAAPQSDPARRSSWPQQQPPQSQSQPGTPDLAALLPTTARLLLLAAYLASHNASRHDLTLFSTYHHGRRRRRGGGYAAARQGPRPKHRKIARKLLGAHAFVLERMMAIFAAVRGEWVGGAGAVCGPGPGAAGLDADVGMALSTLASLRLVVRVGAAADLLDRGGKWRINVGWEVIRGVGRSIGVELEEWLID